MARVSPSDVLRGAPPATPDYGDGGRRGGPARRAGITGIVVACAAIVMLFAALTSAMIVRRGLGGDWQTLTLPGILWVNTGVLLASSFAVERARRALRQGRREAFNHLWLAGTVLGFLFLAGQYAAWRQLVAAGVYLATNPSSSFFYLFTVAHALHLAGGLLALVFITIWAWRLRLGPGRRTAVDVSAFYWHFMDGLWIYLLLLFRFWG
ncbi:MAG TPA: cytochrome c oxidase subunit 3 [Bryobacteraceae bacterium]|nr:cytochrome c oxidase subunit 3 [Bryobacteraceae bacterium]